MISNDSHGITLEFMRFVGSNGLLTRTLDGLYPAHLSVHHIRIRVGSSDMSHHIQTAFCSKNQRPIVIIFQRWEAGY